MKICKDCIKKNECICKSDDPACEDFISNNLVTKDIKDKYPTMGRASALREGSKKNRSRLWRER